jgi:hypothetical protein
MNSFGSSPDTAIFDPDNKKTDMNLQLAEDVSTTFNRCHMLPVPVSHVSCAYVISNRVAIYMLVEFVGIRAFSPIASGLWRRPKGDVQYFAYQGES